jgi:hypothetical protein
MLNAIASNADAFEKFAAMPTQQTAANAAQALSVQAAAAAATMRP